MNQVVIDVGARRLRREGVDVHLPPKAFELLMILIANRPNAVPHQRLQEELWPGTHVAETSLPALVAQLRQAFGDTAGDGLVIRTLHRVGYAFVGQAAVAGNGTAGPQSSCRLMWHRRRFDLPAGDSLLGRDAQCRVLIDAESVSRQHARVRVSGTGVTIEDLGSKNGTWVGGARIQGVVELGDGARFQLGSEALRIEFGLETRPTKTVTVEWEG